MGVSHVTISQMQKLIKSEMYGRRQLTLLNIKLNDIDKRLKICRERGPKSHRYMLKQRRKVTENVRNMYGIFVRRKMVAVARLIITNFSNSRFGRSHSTTEAQNNNGLQNQWASRNGVSVNDNDLVNQASSINSHSLNDNDLVNQGSSINSLSVNDNDLENNGSSRNSVSENDNDLENQGFSRDILSVNDDEISMLDPPTDNESFILQNSSNIEDQLNRNAPTVTDSSLFLNSTTGDIINLHSSHNLDIENHII